MEKLNEELMKEMILASRFMLRPHGRPMGQERILRKLANGPILQKDLQEALEVRPGSISEIVSKLEEKGLVTRSKTEEDARAVMLSLTEAGKEKLESLKQRKNLFSSISEEEKEQLKNILIKLNNDWIRREPFGGRGHHHCCGGHHEMKQECGHHHHHHGECHRGGHPHHEGFPEGPFPFMDKD